MGYGISRCRGCGAVIRWMKTSNGKNIPVNPDKAKEYSSQKYFDPKTMESHFATCPKANNFRKPAQGINKDKKVLYFDLETTGVKPDIHGVTQMAFLIEINGKVEDEAMFYAKPFLSDKIEDKALEIQGKTELDLSAYPDPIEIHEKITILFKKYVDARNRNDKFFPAGYQLEFDLGFLDGWFRKCGDAYFGSWQNWRAIDPRPVLHYLNFTGQLDVPDMKLETICKHYGIEIQAHDALSDILATREVIKRVFGEIK